MRIVIIADVMDTGLGGMKTYADNLVRFIPEVDSLNDYFIINHKRSDRDRNVEFISIPYNKYPGKFFLRKFYSVPKRILALNPDVVLETTHMGPFFLKKSIKRVTVIHDLSTFIYPQHYTWINRMAERLLLPGIIRRANHLITVSKSTKQDLQDIFKVDPQKITVIPLGVEELFKPTNNPFVLDKYGIQQPYMLHVGTIQPRKNIDSLIDAYTQLRDQSNKKLQLVLVGKEGWKSKNLIVKIQDNKYRKDIIMTGYVIKEELPVFYSMCELFVLASHYEGFGLPVLEALACGAFSLVADNSSLREVGQENVSYFNNVDLLVGLALNASEANHGHSELRYDRNFKWLLTTKRTIEVLKS